MNPKTVSSPAQDSVGFPLYIFLHVVPLKFKATTTTRYILERGAFYCIQLNSVLNVSYCLNISQAEHFYRMQHLTILFCVGRSVPTASINNEQSKINKLNMLHWLINNTNLLSADRCNFCCYTSLNFKLQCQILLWSK